MDYIPLDLGTVDAEDLRQDARDFIQSQAPAGWRLNPFMDWFLGAVARIAVLILVLAGQVPKAIFKDFLIRVLGLQPNAATYASGTVTVHASAAAGGTLSAGATITIDGVGFVTVADVTVSAAGTASVPVQAVLAGSGGSGLTGTTMLSAPSVTWVDSVTLDAVTLGGEDGETDDEFVDRGADLTPELSSKPILVADVAPILRADPEVYRVMVIKGLVPPSTTGVAGAITVAGMTDTGANISSDGKTRMLNLLGAGGDWIANTDPHVVDPTTNALDISYTAIVRAGADPIAAKVAINAALIARLSPLGHGIPSGGDPTEFEYDNTVRRNDLIVVAGRVDTVEHITDLKLALHGNTLATADVTLTGIAPVPTLAEANIAATVS